MAEVEDEVVTERRLHSVSTAAQEAGMGVNGDLGVHKADLMRFLLGEEFTHVGGFVVTDRMLEMFRGRRPASTDKGADAQ